MWKVVIVANPQVVLVHATVPFESVGHFDSVWSAFFVLVLGLGGWFSFRLWRICFGPCASRAVR